MIFKCPFLKRFLSSFLLMRFSNATFILSCFNWKTRIQIEKWIDRFISLLILFFIFRRSRQHLSFYQISHLLIKLVSKLPRIKSKKKEYFAVFEYEVSELWSCYQNINKHATLGLAIPLNMKLHLNKIISTPIVSANI